MNCRFSPDISHSEQQQKKVISPGAVKFHRVFASFHGIEEPPVPSGSYSYYYCFASELLKIKLCLK